MYGKYMKPTHWWSIKEARESKERKSLGSDKKQNGGAHTSFTLVGQAS